MGLESSKIVFGLSFFIGMLTTSIASGSHIQPSSTASDATEPPQSLQHHNHGISPITTSAHHPTPEPTPKPSLPVSPLSPLGGPPGNKHSQKIHTTLGWSFLLKGKTEAAIAAYRQAIRQDPQSAPAFVGLGITLKSIGEVEMAKKAFLKAVDLNKNFPSALVNLGYLYAEGHFGEVDVSTARRLFHKASQLGDPFASIALKDIKSRVKL